MAGSCNPTLASSSCFGGREGAAAVAVGTKLKVQGSPGFEVEFGLALN